MKIAYRRMMALLIAASVTACGGSSGDGAVVQPSAVEITEANAGYVVSDALHAGVFGLEVGILPSLEILAGKLPPGKLPKPGKIQGLDVSKTLSPLFESHLFPMGELCHASENFTAGDFTVSGELANPDDLSSFTAGDTLRLVYAFCDNGQGHVLDGAIDITIVEFAGSLDTHLFKVSMTASVTDFSVDDGDVHGPATLNGAYSLLIDSWSYPIRDISVEGDLLVGYLGVLPLGYPGVLPLTGISEIGFLAVKDFTSNGQLDEGAFMIANSASGIVESDHYDGQATYTAVVPFVGQIGSNPYGGEMLITGANNATIRIIALDLEMVRLEMDYDGDGAVDETRDLTWDEATS
ncbi:MAG: hypothetical protein OEM03_01875 [Chromatiales bacterium]|nr:hypothetical protein [Chromatiales bacterium]